MKSISTNILALLLLSITNINCLFAQTPNTWTGVSPCPVHRAWAASFAIGQNIYCGTGVDSNSNVTNDFWKYNTVANTWTKLASFPGRTRADAVAFAIGGKGYLGLGDSGSVPITYFNDLYQYDTLTNTWSAIALFPLSNGSGNANGFSINGKGYVCLGSGDSGSSKILNDYLYEYDPAIDVWTAKAPFAGGARWLATCFTINNKAYVGLGTDSISYLTDFYAYDPIANSWVPIAPFPSFGRVMAAGFSMCDYGYAGMGAGGSTGYSDFFQYDALSNNWAVMSTYPGAPTFGEISASTNVAGANTYGYAGMGQLGSASNFYKYTPPASCFATEIKDAGAKMQDGLKIFPNPTTDEINIVSSNGPISYELFNVLGGQVKCTHVFGNKHLLNVANMPCGIYTLKIIDPNGVAVYKRVLKN